MEIKLASGHFYGQTQASRVVAGFRLMETAYPSGIKLPKHSHERAFFSLMLQGALTENYRTRSLEWSARVVGFNPANEEHSNVIHEEGARFFIVEIEPDLAKRARKHSLPLDRSVVFHEGLVNWLGFRLYREAQQSDEVSSLAIEGLALEMIAEMSRSNTKFGESSSPYWLRQARDLIQAQFAESLNVSSIAGTVGVHPVHLARTFRRKYGSTIGDYVRQLRLELACREISSTDLPFAEIAAKAGFYDQGHLSRLFKRFSGMTPGQYRSVSRPR